MRDICSPQSYLNEICFFSTNTFFAITKIDFQEIALGFRGTCFDLKTKG